MNLKTKQSLSIVFAIGGVMGTIGTVFLARKAAIKEGRMRSPNGCIYPEIMPITPKKEQVKKLLPIYAPTIGLGVITISSIIGSTIMSHKAQASLMSMAIMADQGWRKYKNQVKSTLGIDNHANVIKDIAKKTLHDGKVSDGLELYFDEYIGYFEAKPEDVAYAYAEINEMISTNAGDIDHHVFEGVNLGHFLRIANAIVPNMSQKKEMMHNQWGWSLDYLADVGEKMWISMVMSDYIIDAPGDRPYKIIYWSPEPMLLFGEDSRQPNERSVTNNDSDAF